MNINGKVKAQQTYDVIVIGSGISGGWAAKELTEKGLQVLLLDRGRNVEHVKDYTTATKHPWEFAHRGRLTEAQKQSHPYLKRDYPYSEFNEGFWLNDNEERYTEKKRFDWYRSGVVGGKSLMWGRQTYRLTDLDFEANAKEGIAVDWPIRYRDIAPWYDYVEKFTGISGNKDGIPHLPDGQFLPPMELFCVEKEVKKQLEAKFKGRHLIIGRTANLTVPHQGRGSCQYRDLCSRGCPYGAYFSTQASTLPAAMATGNLTLRPNSLVDSIIYDEKKGKATGVKVIDTESNDLVEYYAKVIFVNGSTLGSTFVLLNSTSQRFPYGLGNGSGQLGHNLMDHHFRTGAAGLVEGYDAIYYAGRRPNGIYIPRFRNIGQDKRNYLRGFGYEGSGSREGWTRGLGAPGVGAGFKESLTKPGAWKLGIIGYGECLPYYENQVSLNHNLKNKYDQPTLIIDAEFKENEKKMRVDMMNDAVEMLEASGLKYVTPFDDGCYPGMAIHEMGTARMGKDPKTSVLNGFNQMHEVPNVFVTDGACMTSSANQNPSLTYMALTARACDYAVKELKKGNLV